MYNINSLHCPPQSAGSAEISRCHVLEATGGGKALAQSETEN